MNQNVVPNAALLAQLAELVASSNLFNGAKVGLFKTNLTLTPGLAHADLDAVKCDFSGYALSSAIVWGTAFYSPLGVPTVAGDLKVFSTANPTTIGNTVYGYYVVDGADAVLLWARKFDNPVLMNDPLRSIEVIPSYPAFLPQ